MVEDAAALALQDLVEEAEMPVVDLVRARVLPRTDGDRAPRRVLPRPHQELLWRRADAAEARDDAGVEDVVPAAGVQRRHGDAGKVRVHGRRPPIVVEARMLDP